MATSLHINGIHAMNFKFSFVAALCAAGVVLFASPAEAGTMAIDLDHNYAFSEGLVVSGRNAGWRYAEMEDYGAHFHGIGDGLPWGFEYGSDQHDNICIPVSGCGSDKIVPVITLGTATDADGLSATVLTDAELSAKLHVGECNVGDDECWYRDEWNKLSYIYPLSAWPDGKTVDGRQWILVSLKNISIGIDGFFSPRTFTVGVEGTGLTTPVITVYPDDDLPRTTRFTPSNVFGIDIDFQIYDGSSFDGGSFDPFFGLWDGGFGDGHGAAVPYVFDAGDDDEGDFVPIRFSLPSSGELYLKIETDYYGGSGTWNMQVDGLRVSGNAYGGIRTCGDADLWHSSFYVVISAKGAGEIVLENFDEKLLVNGIWFRPSDVAATECLATEAWYREGIKVANDIGMANYRGFVTGMGVTKFGGKATLVCHPNEGEKLDHWEFVNCTQPSDATIHNETLTFTVSKSMYDEIEAEEGALKRVIVRPVFKQKLTGEYKVVFAPGFDGVAPSMPEQVVGVGKVAKLNLCAYEAPKGKKFAGWRRADNGRRYDDRVMVFNLAEPGEVVTLTAIWE